MLDQLIYLGIACAATAFTAYWIGVGSTERRLRDRLEDLREANDCLREAIADQHRRVANARDRVALTPAEIDAWHQLVADEDAA